MKTDTRTTRAADTGRDMANYKPHRTKAQKAEARRLAHRCSDGAWRSSAPKTVRERNPLAAPPEPPKPATTPTDCSDHPDGDEA